MPKPRININWGPLTEEQSIETVTDFLRSAGEAVGGAQMADAILAGLADDEDARAALYDKLREEFE